MALPKQKTSNDMQQMHIGDRKEVHIPVELSNGKFSQPCSSNQSV